MYKPNTCLYSKHKKLVPRRFGLNRFHCNIKTEPHMCTTLFHGPFYYYIITIWSYTHGKFLYNTCRVMWSNNTCWHVYGLYMYTRKQWILYFYRVILYFTFLFSLFVFVSATGQYFSILTGPDEYNVFFRILSELVLCLRYAITKTCRLTNFHVLSII